MELPSDQGQQQEAPAAPAHDTDPPITRKPEPLGPYGEEMPTRLGDLLAYEYQGESLFARWSRRGLELGPDEIRNQVRKAMAYRAELDGPKKRTWSWPENLISKVDDWIGRAREQHLRRLTTEARAAKAGVQVVSAIVDPHAGVRYVRDDPPRSA